MVGLDGIGHSLDVHRELIELDRVRYLVIRGRRVRVFSAYRLSAGAQVHPGVGPTIDLDIRFLEPLPMVASVQRGGKWITGGVRVTDPLCSTDRPYAKWKWRTTFGHRIAPILRHVGAGAGGRMPGVVIRLGEPRPKPFFLCRGSPVSNSRRG